ncbi:MAG: hypothetical protein RL757_85 [Bacteroidota bacterium]|jgi:RNAse (barnase) inhibitor barstar
MKNFKILKKKYEGRSKDSLLVAVVDGKNCPTAAEFYKQIAKALALPNYFGKNMDALFDMLCDFSWADLEQVHIVLRNYDDLLSEEKDGNLRIDFLIVLHDSVAEWKSLKSKDALSLEVYVEPNTKFKDDLDAAMEDS